MVFLIFLTLILVREGPARAVFVHVAPSTPLLQLPGVSLDGRTSSARSAAGA
ncbi:MAG TPA: hypothetical protein VIJ86_05960 [Acidimicrobiales bacterium]